MAAEHGQDVTSIQTCLDVTDCMVLRSLQAYVIVGPLPAGSVKPDDLPLHAIDPAKMYSTFFDIMPGAVEKVQMEPPIRLVDQLKPIIKDKAFSELPDTFKLKELLPATAEFQLFLVPQIDGNYCVIKHYSVQKTKLKGSVIVSLCKGDAKVVRWGDRNHKNMKKALHFMLEQMGGMQFKISALESAQRGRSSCEPPMRTDADLDAGFDYIRQHGLGVEGKFQQVVWVRKEIASESSPLHKWHPALVKAALEALHSDGTFAKVTTTFGIALADFDDWLLSVIWEIAPCLIDHSLWLLGEAGAGKTPLARAIANMLSRYWGGRGMFRSTTDLDFLRGVRGSKQVPVIADDPGINGVEIKKTKSFSDVSLGEAMSKERWSGVFFVQGQLRIVCDNLYDPQQEPPNAGPFLSNTIKHEEFLQIIAPAFPEGTSRQNVEAILKRAVFIVNSTEWLYWRKPGVEARDVSRIFLGEKKTFLKDTSGPIMAAIKADEKYVPTGYADKIAWEDAMFADVLKLKRNAEPLQAPPPESADPVAEEDVHEEGPMAEEGPPEDDFDVDPFGFGGGIDGPGDDTAGGEPAPATPDPPLVAVKEEPKDTDMWDHAELDTSHVGGSKRKAFFLRLHTMSADGPIDLDSPLKK